MTNMVEGERLPMSKQHSDQDDNQNWVDLAHGECGPIRVSNPAFPIPTGLKIIPEFLTDDEATCLLRDLDFDGKWRWGGFTQKLRIQKYNVDNSLPSVLERLVSRLVTTLKRRPSHVIVEEYPRTSSSGNGQRQRNMASNNVVTTFESMTQCDSEASSCSCFVAQVVLLAPAIQHLNRPKRRDPECWALASEDHWTDIMMEPQTLIVKSDECLWDWRSRVSPLDGTSGTDRVVIVKFCCLPDSLLCSATTLDPIPTATDAESDGIESPILTVEGNGRATKPMPPLKDILTIIVTTSPIRSNPSTELLEKTFESFPQGGDDFAYKCRKVIVCDGCRVVDSENTSVKNRVSRKHSNVKQALRNGIATTTQAERYQEFKENLKTLCKDAPPDSPFWNTLVEELQKRHGYGFALRHALRHCVTTPFVCVIQHDRTFMRPTPVRDTLHAMWNHPHVKYVGMSMRSNLMYLDIFQSKYGKAASEDMANQNLILRLPELALDASVFGPEGSSCREITCLSPNVVKSTATLSQAYKGSAQCVEQQEWAKKNPPAVGRHQLTLTPTLFWYDNTHICDTAHYHDFVFDPKYQMVARGGFVEDKLSPNITKSVERLGLAEGHARFGCYLLDDHSGTFFTGHLDGGNYLTVQEREKFSSK